MSRRVWFVLFCALALGACAPTGEQEGSAVGTLAAAGELAGSEPGSEPVRAEVRVDKATATTGDLITYSIELDRAKDIEVTVPEPGPDIAGFRIVDIGRDEPITVRASGGEERIRERVFYRLRADLVGSYILPAITLSYEDKESKAQKTLETSEIFVEVQSVLPKEKEATDIRDIKPLEPVKRPLSPLVWLLVLAAVLLLGFLYHLFRKRQQRALPEAPKPLPHEVAFRELDRLRNSDFTDLPTLRRYYFALSQVIRRYVEARFGLNATDLTREEILARLPELTELDPQASEELSEFLGETDQVKFAKHLPKTGEIEETYERALRFIEQTVPAHVESPEDASPGEGA